MKADKPAPDSYQYLNKGLIVYQAMAGKNMMGTPRPGKSSGDLTSNGSDIEMGIITMANETMENIKLKMISPRFLKSLIHAKFKTAASMQNKKQ